MPSKKLSSKQVEAKKLLYDTVEEIKEYVVCAVIHGSLSNFSSKLPDTSDNEWDLDFYIIYKANTPISIHETVTNRLDRGGFPYEYGWRTEEKLVNMLKEGRSFFVWNEIFKHGEIIYSMPEFMEKVMEIVESTDPSRIFEPNFKYWDTQQKAHIKRIIRALYEKLLNTMEVLYYIKTNEIPEFCDFLSLAEKKGIFNEETITLYKRLEEMSKMERIKKYPKLEKIGEIEKKLNRAILDMRKEINDYLLY